VRERCEWEALTAQALTSAILLAPTAGAEASAAAVCHYCSPSTGSPSA
jgi:hypothetical protein